MRLSNRFFHLGLVAGFALTSAGLCWALGYRVNLTPSYPRGVYRLCGKAWARGDLVLYQPDRSSPGVTEGLDRGYLVVAGWHVRPLIKRVAGIPGDSVTVGSRVAVNGKELPNGGVLRADAEGRRLVPAQGGRLAPGEVWLASDANPRSYDSRYFGPVPAGQIEGRIDPVWTW